MVEDLERSVSEFDRRLEVALEPFRDDIERLTAIPGVSTTAAQVILAEIGPDMSRWVTRSRGRGFGLTRAPAGVARRARARVRSGSRRCWYGVPGRLPGRKRRICKHSSYASRGVGGRRRLRSPSRHPFSLPRTTCCDSEPSAATLAPTTSCAVTPCVWQSAWQTAFGSLATKCKSKRRAKTPGPAPARGVWRGSLGGTSCARPETS